MIYTTAYMAIHLTFEDLFMVGILNAAVSFCRTAAQERKNQFQQPKHFETHLSKRTGSFHSAASFLVCLTVPGSSMEENFSIKLIPKKILKKRMQKKREKEV